MTDLDLVLRAHPSPQHLDQFNRFCRVHDHDRQADRPTDKSSTPPVTVGRIYVVAYWDLA